MPASGYANRKAARHAAAGRAERSYAEMRQALEEHLLRSPTENGRFVEVIAGEERLREALSQRVTVRQVLDVMEQRWPYPAQRIALVRQIAEAVGTAQLRFTLDDVERRYNPRRPPAPALEPAEEPSSVSVEPSMSTLPPLQRPVSVPLARPEEEALSEVDERREIIFSNLATLPRGRWRDLAFELRMTVGCVDDIERSSGSSREGVRRMLDTYFRKPRLHKGDQFGTVIRALRELNLNMTADRLTEELRW